jgi:hypothetical protein
MRSVLKPDGKKGRASPAESREAGESEKERQGSIVIMSIYAGGAVALAYAAIALFVLRIGVDIALFLVPFLAIWLVSAYLAHKILCKLER